MKRTLALALCLCAAGCDNDQVRACEAQLKDKLASPASYRRVKVDQLVNDTYAVPYHEVTITYDSANPFNVLLRGHEDCFYKPGTTESIDPFAAIAASANAAAEAAARAAMDNAPAAATADRAAHTPPEGATILARQIPQNLRREEAEENSSGGETYTDGQPDSQLDPANADENAH